MNISKVFLPGLFIASSFISATSNHGVYYSELRAFKKAAATKEIFDEDAHSGLAKIQRDITTYKNLSLFQRMVRSMLLMFDVVVATPETMPKLYAYTEGICKKASIKTPTIFITRQRWLLNAAAQKLLMSSGAIIIGQKLMHDISDDALEGVIAHEIGHVKYNHVNKHLVLDFLNSIVKYMVSNKALQILLIKNHEALNSGNKLQSALVMCRITMQIIFLRDCINCLPALIINKRFEKEADNFACQNGKSKGIIEFFEYMLKKEELREEEFVAIKALLEENGSQLSLFDNLMLGLRYQIAKLDNFIDKTYRYIYYNTFLGAHPSPEARIEAAKKYLQQEA